MKRGEQNSRTDHETLPPGQGLLCPEVHGLENGTRAYPRRRGIVLTALVLCILPLLFVSCADRPQSLPGGAEIGKPAPDFTLPGLGGDRISLKTFRGKVVLIDFWATWCPPCRNAMPGLNELYKRNFNRGFEVLAVSLDESPEPVRGFAKAENILFPVAVSGTDVAKQYGVTQVPAVFLLDKNGIVVHSAVGHSPALEKRIAGWVEELL